MKCNLRSTSGVRRHCRNRRLVRVCNNCHTPLNVGANVFGLCKMSFQSCSNSGIRATFCSNLKTQDDKKNVNKLNIYRSDNERMRWKTMLTEQNLDPMV